MIRFGFDVLLPASFCDFTSHNHPVYPHFTLMTREDAERGGVEDDDGSNGWVDLVLDVPAIDESTARSVIAARLGVPVEQIELVQESW